VIQPPQSVAEVRTRLRRQALNLEEKIQLIDALDLCGTKITQEFRTARAFVVAAESVPGAEAWKLAADLWNHVMQSESARVITQPDYDQMSFSHHWAGLLDCPSFRAKHIPSAIATVDTYRKVLGAVLPADDKPTISIIGLGELGGRICDAFLHAGNAVVAFDIDSRRYEPFAGRDRFSAAPSLLDALRSRAAATVFCAHANSLSASVARTLVGRDGSLCVGGPEAGLDRDGSALRILRDGGVHFIPSMLCGSLGLAANLEEALGLPASFERARHKLAEHVAKAIGEMSPRGELFDESWVRYTQSILGDSGDTTRSDHGADVTLQMS